MSCRRLSEDAVREGGGGQERERTTFGFHVDTVDYQIMQLLVIIIPPFIE